MISLGRCTPFTGCDSGGWLGLPPALQRACEELPLHLKEQGKRRENVVGRRSGGEGALSLCGVSLAAGAAEQKLGTLRASMRSSTKLLVIIRQLSPPSSTPSVLPQSCSDKDEDSVAEELPS